MTDLTAIDIEIDPEEAMISRAKEANARMLNSIPSGIALDEHHQPHITTLQRYVRTADLDQVFDAVEGVITTVDVANLKLTAFALKHTKVARCRAPV
jgi:hypothetical protein